MDGSEFSTSHSVPHSTTETRDGQETERLDSIMERIKKRTPARPYSLSTPSDRPYKVTGQEAYVLPAKLEYSSFLYRDTSNMILSLEAQHPVEDRSRLGGSGTQIASQPSTPAVGPRKKISLADYKKRNRNQASSANATQNHTPDVTAPQSGATVMNGNVKPGTKTSDGIVKAEHSPAIDSAHRRHPSNDQNSYAGPSSNQESSPMESRNRKDPDTATQAIPVKHILSVTGRGPEPTGSVTAAAVMSTSDKPAARVSDAQELNDQFQSHHPYPGKVEQTAAPDPGHQRSGEDVSAVVNPSAPTSTQVRVDAGHLPGVQGTRPAVNANEGSSTRLSTVADVTPEAPQYSLLTVSAGSLSPSALKMSAATSGSSATSADLSILLPTDAAFDLAQKQSNTASTQSHNHQQSKSSDNPPKNAINGTKSPDVRKPAETLGNRAKSGTKRSLDNKELDPAQPDKKRRKSVEVTKGTPSVSKSDSTLKPHADPKQEAASSKETLRTPQRQIENGSQLSTVSSKARASITPNISASEKRVLGAKKKWDNEKTRLHKVGKELKLESTKHSDNGKSTKNVQQKTKSAKLAVVKKFESILAFMMAFCAQDQIDQQDEGWRGVRNFIQQLISAATDYGILKGFAHLLYVTCARRSVSILGNSKLAKNMTVEDYFAYSQKCIQSIEEHSTAADRLISKTSLAKKYPATCKAMDSAPFTSPSTICVVRVGLKFLEEFTKQQSMVWHPTLNEGLCTQL